MAPRRDNLLSGLKIQFRSIKALMLRDMIMRNGRENIGFGWVLLEPMILCVGVMLIWSLIGGHGHDGISIIEMVLTGYMPLTLWRHLTNSAVGMFARSVPLLYHRRVSPFDILLSKIFLEFIGTTAAFALVWAILYSMGFVSGVVDLGLVIVGWIMMGLLGVGGAALLATATERWEAAERFIQPAQYLLVPISGCFFLVDWAPSWAVDILLLNPMVHCYEVIRAGFFGETIQFHYDFGYFFACAFVLVFAGTLCINWVRPLIRIN